MILDPAVVAIPHGRGRSARLLLVPADGVDLGVPLSERSPLDERPCLLLLDFNDVRNTPDQVSPALIQFAGDRFVDLRQVADARFSVEFSIVLRGYDPGAVDPLIAAGRRALLSGGWPQRVEAKARIEGASLPIVMRGYDRDQVDTVLHGLSAELAVWPGDEQPPKQRHDRPRVDG